MTLTHRPGAELAVELFVPDDAPRAPSEPSVKKLCETAAWAAARVTGVARDRVVRCAGARGAGAGYRCGSAARADTAFSALRAAVFALHEGFDALRVRVRLDARARDPQAPPTFEFELEVPRP